MQATERTSADWLVSVGDSLRPGDVLGGKYELLQLIGCGGMGAVVEARHVDLDESVAVKLLRPDLVDNEDAVNRFIREARTAFRIRSEHVTQIYDVGTTDEGVPYMAMELLDGHDLATELAKRKRIPFAEAIDLFMQLCEAVRDGHDLGIVHRDLKPENVFLCPRRDDGVVVKILDFGLSKMARDGGRSRRRSLTATSAAMGTPAYMSPEQWACAKTTGPSTDIWALGVVLYEMLSGELPFDGDTIPELYTQVLDTDPTPLSALGVSAPSTVDRTISHCLDKDPAQRFATVADLMAALAPFAARSVRVSATKNAGSFGHGRTDTVDALEATVRMDESISRTRSDTEVIAPEPLSIDEAASSFPPQSFNATPAKWTTPLIGVAICAAALVAAVLTFQSGVESSAMVAPKQHARAAMTASVATPDAATSASPAEPRAADTAAQPSISNVRDGGPIADAATSKRGDTTTPPTRTQPPQTRRRQTQLPQPQPPPNATGEPRPPQPAPTKSRRDVIEEAFGKR